jgi:predicted acetyltransferase
VGSAASGATRFIYRRSRELISDLLLRLPREDEEEEFLRAHRATSPGAPSFLHHYEEGMPFRCYLEMLTAHERGIDLPSGAVPESFLFAFVDQSIVGRVSIRHSLNDYLERFGGHIGCVIVPAFRRRGYATVILRLAIQHAVRRLGLRRILLTCRDDNVGSIRAIEKNGGILESVVAEADGVTPLRRYWIASPTCVDASSRELTEIPPGSGK